MFRCVHLVDNNLTSIINMSEKIINEYLHYGCCFALCFKIYWHQTKVNKVIMKGFNVCCIRNVIDTTERDVVHIEEIITFTLPNVLMRS